MPNQLVDLHHPRLRQLPRDMTVRLCYNTLLVSMDTRLIDTAKTVIGYGCYLPSMLQQRASSDQSFHPNSVLPARVLYLSLEPRSNLYPSKCQAVIQHFYISTEQFRQSISNSDSLFLDY